MVCYRILGTGIHYISASLNRVRCSTFRHRKLKNSEAFGANIKLYSANAMSEKSVVVDEEKIKIIRDQYELLVKLGEPVPSVVGDSDWNKMVNMTLGEKKRYFRYLLNNELMEAKTKSVKMERYMEYQRLAVIHEEKLRNNEIVYSSKYNSMFPILHSNTKTMFYNLRLKQGIMFGQDLVFDLSYEDYMSTKDCGYVARQVGYSNKRNKLAKEPFHIHICNVSSGDTLNMLKKVMPGLGTTSCAINMTSKSYLELFPKEKLIYMTPHCENDLTEYDHDAVYIIGGFVDCEVCMQRPISLYKAQADGLKMARLPLDLFLRWKTGVKTLPLVQVMQALMYVKDNLDWKTALKKSITPHKIKNETEK